MTQSVELNLRTIWIFKLNSYKNKYEIIKYENSMINIMMGYTVLLQYNENNKNINIVNNNVLKYYYSYDAALIGLKIYLKRNIRKNIKEVAKNKVYLKQLKQLKQE